MSGFFPAVYINKVFGAPETIVWLPYFFIVFSIILYFLDRSVKHKKIKLFGNKKKFKKYVYILIILSVISTLMNIKSGGIILNFINLLLYISWIIFLGFSVPIFNQYMTNKNINKLLKIFVYIGILNVPITLIQRVILVQHLGLNSPDIVCGVFDVYDELVFFQLFCIGIIFIWWLFDEKIISLPNFIVIVLLLIPLILSNSKGAWLFLFLSILYIIKMILGKISISKLLKISVPVLFVILISLVFFNELFVDYYKYPFGYKYILDKNYIIEYYFGGKTYSSKFTKGNTLKRGAGILYVYDMLKKDPLRLFIGLGPNNISIRRSPFISNENRVYMEFKYYDLYKVFVPSLIGGIGITGLIVVSLLIRNSFFTKRNNSKSKMEYLKKYTIFVIIIMSFYFNIAYSTVMYIVLASVLIEVKRNAKYGS